jgi:Phage major capsid protein E
MAIKKKNAVWTPFQQQQQQVKVERSGGSGVQGGAGDTPTPYSIMSIDLGEYDTISLIEAYKIRYVVPSFIRDMFFAGREYPDSDVVQIDTKRGGRSLAPAILDYEGQIVERRRPFQRTFIPAPTYAPARVITLRDAKRPAWGENQYNYKTPEQRIAEMYAEDTEEMDDELARTEEWMCCETMFNGQFTINYRNKTSVTIDYGFLNTVALALPWTDQNSNPFNDLQQSQAALNRQGYNGNIAIYSPEAWSALWNNPNVRDVMKNMNYNLGGPITSYSLPEALPNLVQIAPAFSYPVMSNYIYSGIYNVGGNPVPYVPPGKVLLGSSNVRNRIAYAMITQIEQTDGQFHSYSLERVPKVECNVNKNYYMYTMTSRPVPIPIDMESWIVLEGVV